MKNIERGEARISRKDDIMKAIGKKLYHYKNPWHELKIQYGQIKGKLYNEDAIVSCLEPDTIEAVCGKADCGEPTF
ncbi:ISWI chromatin-remodeling complex ATPase chr11 [Orobanche hederae]